MSDTPPSLIDKNPYYDEMSISELLMKLWSKRGLIVMLPLVFAGLTMVGLLAGKTNHQTAISMYVELVGISLRNADIDSDTDENITTRYPNGTIFSPQDLTNPTVLRSLAEQTSLNAQSLATYIDVQFGTPISNAVLAEYQSALAAASAQDLAGLNERYGGKIDVAAKRGLKITVDYLGLGISEAAGAQIAEKLLQLWNQVYTQQFVTLLPARILGLRWTNEIHDLTSPTGLQEASIQLDAIEQGIDAILADGRLVGLLNMHNVNATDIKTYLGKFREIRFEPLFLAAFDSDTSLTRVYERDISIQMKVLNAEIEELNRRLLSLGNFGGSIQLKSDGGLQESSPGLDGGALSQLVSLAEQAALSSYIEASLEKKYELISEKARLEGRLERMRPGTNMGATTSVTGTFVDQATQRYRAIVSGYDDMLNKAKEIVGSTTPSFYSITTQPDTEPAPPLFSKQDLPFLALAVALGGMLAVVAALVWPQRQDV